MSQETAAGESLRENPPPAGATEPIRVPEGMPPDPAGSGTHRRTRQTRQRPIRSTLTVLLVIPLVSLIALWAYAASSTVSGALAKRNSDTANKLIGAPTQALFEQLVQERADTFIWQKARGLQPKTALVAQRKLTDDSVVAFRAAVKAAAGVQTAVAQSGEAAMLAKLAQLPQIRAQVDAGTLKPLAAFQAYNDIYGPSFALGHGTLADPNMGVTLYEQGEGAADEGEALEYVGREAALVGGALVSGGKMTVAEHQLFVQYVGEQRLIEQIGGSPGYWQQNQDPYLPVFASPAYKTFKAMEDQIVAAAPGTRIPVSPQAWQQGLTQVMGPFIAAEVLTRQDTTKGAAHQGDVVLLRLFIVGGAGLLAVIVSAVLLLGFGNRITRELTGLRGAVRGLADVRLPALVDRLRRGDDVDVATEAPPLTLRTKTKEVTETADAFSAVQRTAVEAAVGQAQLRKGVSNVFRSLSRRNQSLLQRQLRMLDEMERGTHDPEALAQLFRLDHLTTRMRRQAEGLIILSGATPGRGWRKPVPVVEVLRGAIGEIEDYVRVELVTESSDFLTGTAVADVTHLLAELVENAVLYSPPNTKVEVKAGRVANGYVVEIEDRGLGIPPAALDALNDRLTRPPEFDLADSDQLGLFVVSRLAARHQIKVSLRGSPYGGTAAIVLLPPRLVVAEDQVALNGHDPNATSPHAATGTDGPHAATGTDGPHAAIGTDGPHAAAGTHPGTAPHAAIAPSADTWIGKHRPFLESAPPSPEPAGGMTPPPDWFHSPAQPAAPTPAAPGVPTASPAPETPSVSAAPAASAPAASASAASGPADVQASASDGPPSAASDGPAQAAPGAPGTAGNYLGLPRRLRQASLAPQLRDAPTAAASRGGRHEERSPEQVRAMLSSIQQGWRSGRAAADQAEGDVPGTPEDRAGS